VYQHLCLVISISLLQLMFRSSPPNYLNKRGFMLILKLSSTAGIEGRGQGSGLMQGCSDISTTKYLAQISPLAVWLGPWFPVGGP
jgi:hypothetical protein